MIQNEDDNADWVQTLGSAADADHTLAGQCRGTDQEEKEKEGTPNMQYILVQS